MRGKILPSMSASGRSFALEYKKIDFIGKGSFGEVWTCKELSTGQEFAVKVINKDRVRSESQKSDILREVGFLNIFQGQHPGLVQLREVLETEREVHLVMEMCRGGDLLKLVTNAGKLPEASAKVIFRQLASALAMCHSKGVVHRDIKPENILFDRDATSLCEGSFVARVTGRTAPPAQAKLADFGLSVVVAPGDTTKGCAGSKFYVAPEMVQGREYDSKVDTWSLGVVLCAMLTGRLPFTGKTFEDDDGLIQAILHGELDFRQSHWKGVSKGAKALIKQMLDRDPKERLSSEGLVAHPWAAEPSTRRLGFLLSKPKSRSGPITGRHTTRVRDDDQPIDIKDLEEPEVRHTPMSPEPAAVLRRSQGLALPPVSSVESEDRFHVWEPWASPLCSSPESPYTKYAAQQGHVEGSEESSFEFDVGLRRGFPKAGPGPALPRATPFKDALSAREQDSGAVCSKDMYYACMLGLNPHHLQHPQLVREKVIIRNPLEAH